MDISIINVIGQRCVTQEDGQKLHDLIWVSITNGAEVMLDFDGVTKMASPFFNFAFGQLYSKVNEDEMARLVRIVNLNDVGNDIIKRVKENAINYTTKKGLKNIVDEILLQQSEDE